MVTIIGNGIAGITAARHIRKESNVPIAVISSESKYFFSRTALMYVYMGHMRFEHMEPYEPDFWIKNNIELIYDHVDKIKTETKTLSLRSGKELTFDSLIIASGSCPSLHNWKGQDAKGVITLYSKQDLEKMELASGNVKRACVIGGGLIGIEMAEMLLSRKIEVDFIIREKAFMEMSFPQEDYAFIRKELDKHHGLNIYTSEELEEIIRDNSGNVKAIKTKSGREINCQLVGLTTGVKPNIDFIRSSSIPINKGVIVNRFLETEIPSVYAIGDCAEFSNPLTNRKSIEQTWYTARIMGETVAQTILGKRSEYQPGHWYNSAKFFDLEYQNYGIVRHQLSENESNFVFQSKRKNVQLHFVFHKETRQLIGINAFGIRLRQSVIEYWLDNRTSMEELLANFRSANFDPEFYSSIENELIDAYNSQFNSSIRLKKSIWWQKLISSSK